jgi:hypothetical protein
VVAECLDIVGAPANNLVLRMESAIANTDGDNRSVPARKRLSPRCVYAAQLVLALAPACVAAPITNLVAFEVGYFIKAI